MVANRYSGMEPDLVAQDAALVFASAYKQAKIEGKSIENYNLKDSYVGSDTEISTDAMRILFDIKGTNTFISGTIEPFREFLGLLNGKPLREVGPQVRLEVRGDINSKRDRLYLLEGNEYKGELREHLADNPYEKMAEIAKDLQDKGKPVFILVSEESLPKLVKAFQKQGIGYER